MRPQTLAEQLKTEFLGRKEILYPMINNSGGALIAGNVVLIDTTLDRAVTIGTTGADYVCGLVVIGGINGAIVWVASFGVWPVIVDAGGCANGDGLAISSASAGEAMTVGALPSATTIFAMALETVASGLCMCELRLPASVAGGSVSVQHPLLSTTHPDTAAKTPPDQGDVIVARGSGSNSLWTAVACGNLGDVFEVANTLYPNWAGTTDGEDASLVVRTDGDAGIHPKRLGVNQAVPGTDGICDVSLRYDIGAARALSAPGTGNIIVGIDAGAGIIPGTTSVDSVIIGNRAAFTDTAAYRNVVIGHGALELADNTGYNVAIGWHAMDAANSSDASYDTAVGGNAAPGLTTAAYVTALGYSAGSSITTEDYVTCLGAETEVSAGAHSSIAIGFAAHAYRPHQLSVGASDPDGVLTESYWGSGVTSATAADFSFNGTGGVGNNKAGASLIFAGGQGTGTGLGGSVIIKTAPIGAPGAALNALLPRVTVDSAGRVTVADLTASTVIYSDASKMLTSLANAAGYLTNDGAGALSWSAGATPSAHAHSGGPHTGTLLIAELAPGTAAGQVIIAGAGPGFAPGWSAFTLSGTGELALTVTASKKVTLTATDNSGIVFTGACALTIPTAGSVTAALLGTANVFTVAQTIQYASGLDGSTPVSLTLYSTNNGTWTDEAIYAQLLFGNADLNGTAGTRTAIKAYIDHVNGGDSGLSFWITTDGAAGCREAMRINHQGYVGVGVIDPLAPIHAVNTAAAVGIYDIYSGASGTALSWFMFAGRGARGTAASPVAVAAGDVLFGLGGRGYNSAAFTTSRAALGAQAAETWTSTANGAYLAFHTTPIGSVTQTERVRITDIGSLLVGTTTDGMTAGGSLAIAQDLAHRGTKAGFFNIAPVARPTAYTQTYSTASKTVPAMTYAAPAGGATVDTEARASLAQLAADVLAYLKVLTAVIDDGQALGLLQ